VAVFTEQNVLWFQIPVNNAESVQILQDLDGKESDGLKGEAVAGLSAEEGVEVEEERRDSLKLRRWFRQGWAQGARAVKDLRSRMDVDAHHGGPLGVVWPPPKAIQKIWKNILLY
jgi:hypothetical protein